MSTAASVDDRLRTAALVLAVDALLRACTETLAACARVRFGRQTNRSMTDDLARRWTDWTVVGSAATKTTKARRRTHATVDSARIPDWRGERAAYISVRAARSPPRIKGACSGALHPSAPNVHTVAAAMRGRAAQKCRDGLCVRAER